MDTLLKATIIILQESSLYDKFNQTIVDSIHLKTEQRVVSSDAQNPGSMSLGSSDRHLLEEPIFSLSFYVESGIHLGPYKIDLGCLC